VATISTARARMTATKICGRMRFEPEFISEVVGLMNDYFRQIAQALRELPADQRKLRLNLMSEAERRSVRAAYRDLFGETCDGCIPVTVSQPISIFDLDGTLTRRSTFGSFLLFSASQQQPWRICLLPALLPFVLGYLLNLASRQTLKEAMHAILIGRQISRSQADRLADAFATKLEEMIFVQRLALLSRRSRMREDGLSSRPAPRCSTSDLSPSGSESLT